MRLTVEERATVLLSPSVEDEVIVEERWNTQAVLFRELRG